MKMLNSSLERESKIEILSLITLIGFFCAVVFHYILAFYFHVGKPLNTFLYHTPTTDFFNTYFLSKDLDPYNLRLGLPYYSIYLPFSYLLFYPFTLVSIDLSYILYMGIFLLGLYIFCKLYFSHDA